MNFKSELRPSEIALLIAITVFTNWPASARTQIHTSRQGGDSGTNAETSKSAEGYFIEFMARPTKAFGHSFVSFGLASKLNVPTKTIGFYPVDNNGNAIFDSPGVITHGKLDIASRSTVKFRVFVSRGSYLQAVRATNLMEQSWVRYDLISHNCNHFIGQIARGLGLKDPGEYADAPEDYVRTMKTVNGGRERASWRNDYRGD